MRKCAHWLEPLSEGETLDVLCSLADRILARGSTAPCHILRQIIRKGDFAQVCDFECDYERWDIDTIRRVRQATALFSKLEFLEIGIDKEAAAVKSLLEAEARCRETNEMFRAYHAGKFCFRTEVAGVLYTAQLKLAQLLGPAPKLQELGLRFGPGATSLTKKREASVKRKLGKGVSCSEDLVPWAQALLNEMPHLARLHASVWSESDEEYWGSVPIELHEGAVSFVLKNAKTYRTTETQPTLNGMMQLGIGDEMSRRLSRVPGLDLRDQTLNQRLARIGSLTDALATLDQKSASNCMAFELVRSLLPLDWWNLLRAARCGRTRIPGKGSVHLEMFAGMGNGFTFPLQSAIFYSLAWATTRQLGIRNPTISVYGDDLIVDAECVPLLKEVLDAAGFWINERKSYVSGKFRESCGSDWVQGIDVRPVYVKERLTPAVLFTLHNGLFRKGWLDEADWVRHQVHPDLVLFGPDGYGDGHLICEDWIAHAHRRGRHRGWGGLSFDTFQTSAKADWTYHPGDRILHTYAIYQRGSSRIVPRFEDDWICTVKRSWGTCRFVRAWSTGHGLCEEPSKDLPFGDKVDADFRVIFGPPEKDPVSGLLIQGVTKVTSFPGVDGYRKTAIYILA